MPRGRGGYPPDVCPGPYRQGEVVSSFVLVVKSSNVGLAFSECIILFLITVDTQ